MPAGVSVSEFWSAVSLGGHVGWAPLPAPRAVQVDANHARKPHLPRSRLTVCVASMPAYLQHRVTAAVVAAAFTACTSTLHVAGQPEVEGRVDGADDHHYYVQNEGGQVIAVPRQLVTDIDLPGNVLAVAGAAGLGLTMGGRAEPQFDETVVMPLLVFGGIAAAGALQWWFAKGALNQPPPPPPILPFIPVQEVR